MLVCVSVCVYVREMCIPTGGLSPASVLSQGTNQQIKAHEASSAVQHVNLLKEWSSSLEKKVSQAELGSSGHAAVPLDAPCEPAGTQS